MFDVDLLDVDHNVNPAQSYIALQSVPNKSCS